MMTQEEKLAALRRALMSTREILSWLRSLHPMRSRSERIVMLERTATELENLHEAISGEVLNLGLVAESVLREGR